MFLPVRFALLAAVCLLAAAGCGDGGGKIEPEVKGAAGSPIMNKDKAPKPPAATTP